MSKRLLLLVIGLVAGGLFFASTAEAQQARGGDSDGPNGRGHGQGLLIQLEERESTSANRPNTLSCAPECSWEDVREDIEEHTGNAWGDLDQDELRDRVMNRRTRIRPSEPTNAIPEPSAAMVFGAGILAVGASIHRRRRD